MRYNVRHRKDSMRTVFAATAIYAAVGLAMSIAVVEIVPLLAEIAPWVSALWLAFSYAILVSVVFLVSRWVVRSSGRRGVGLPLLAWWLSSVTVTLLTWTLVLRAPATAVFAALVPAATLQVLVPDSSASIRLFALGGEYFGVAIPWIALLICLSALLAGREAGGVAASTTLPVE
jgi:hypothetical protein